MKIKHKIKVLAIIIPAAVSIIMPFFQEKWAKQREVSDEGDHVADIYNTEVENSNSIIGDNNSIVEKNENNFFDVDNIINNNIVESENYDFSNKTPDELLKIANNACINGKYDLAFDIYNCDILECNKLARINLGYIYENGISYVGENLEKAEEYYKELDCIEAKRGLLSLYLKSQREEIVELFADLLWGECDEKTWDYVSLCLFDLSWYDYSRENGCSKDEFSFRISDLYEFEKTNEYYKGYNPPQDSEIIKWILTDIKSVINENSFHSYCIYEKYVAKYSKYISNLSCLYYSIDDIFYPLEGDFGT